MSSLCFSPNPFAKLWFMKNILPLILLIFSSISYGQEKLNILDIYLQELISTPLDEYSSHLDLEDIEWRKKTIKKITSDNYREPSFLKTALVLNMLRHKLGNENYINGIDAYLLQLNESNAPTKIKDFISTLETQSDKDLSNFFNDWVVGKGYPSYEINWSQNSNNHNINIVVNQIQSDPSVAFFEMPLEIKISNKNDDFKIIRLDLNENNQHFTVNANFIIDKVEFDPENQLISRNNSVTTGVDQEILDTYFSLYPNPVKNALNIQNLSDATVEKISIYDMLGALVLEEINPLLAINLKPLSFGMHLVKIETNLGVLHKTILKEE